MKAYFIQRSADGSNFTDISSLPAKNQASNDYSFTDNGPLARVSINIYDEAGKQLARKDITLRPE
jgi:hypothetical protein